MKITAIEPQKKNKDRCSVFIDGEFAFGMLVADAYLLGLKEGNGISTKELTELKETVLLTDAKNLALKYLSYSMRTKREVVTKLKTYEFGEELISEVTDFLEQHRYLDDTSYAEKYIAEKTRAGYGEWRIKQELFRRGIDAEIINSCIEENEEDATEKILSLLDRRIKSETEEEFNKKERQKIYNFLNSRGFGYDDTKSAIRQFWEAKE